MNHEAVEVQQFWNSDTGEVVIILPTDVLIEFLTTLVSDKLTAVSTTDLKYEFVGSIA